MITTSTSKRSGHNTGYYAFAGSLLLHAGIIALISSWQWELKAPEKKQSKTIHVKFLPAPPKPEATEKRKPSKKAPASPAEARTLHSAALAKLMPRTPDLAMPSGPPANAARRMLSAVHTPQKQPLIRQTSLFKKVMHPNAARPLKVDQTRHGSRQQKRPLIRQASLFKKAMHPNAARPLKADQTRHGSRQGMGIRPLPAFNTHPARSSQVMAQTNPQLRSYPADIQQRAPAPAVQPAKGSGPPAGRAVSTGRTKPWKNNVRPLPKPAPSPSLSLANTGLEDQPAPEKPVSTKSGGAKVAALPPRVDSSTPDIEDDGGADLGLLRGAFTGKVRQRIANAQSYPRIARRRGMEGQPVIVFTLDKRGRLTQVDLAQTSGYQLLDQAALEAVQQAAPYPEIPAPLKLNFFQFKLPISFVLK